jgi:phage-related baseplate assembly protein
MADQTFTAVDLSRLPAPDIIEPLSYEAIVEDAIARFRAEMAASGVVFESRDSDPATKLLQTFAYLAHMLRQRVNDAARAVMPAYAVGADLDNIAATFGIARLLIIPADPQLGTPAVMESDTEFRRRMVLAPEGFSVAGPEGAYIFHALSADADVLDASAFSPKPDDIRTLVLDLLAERDASPELVADMTAALNSATWPGEVVVSILARSGDGTASADLVSKVAAHLDDESIRPLTDHVVTAAAQIVEYEVEATIRTYSGPDSSVVLASARSRLDAYVAESRRLGRDVTRSGLFAALHAEGVQNVVLTAPAEDITVSRQQAPHCTGITITHAGSGE